VFRPNYAAGGRPVRKMARGFRDRGWNLLTLQVKKKSP